MKPQRRDDYYDDDDDEYDDNTRFGGEPSIPQPSTKANPSTVSPDALKILYVPPLMSQYMFWGPTILAILFLGLMILVIGWLYVISNIDAMQSRIRVIANAALFGRDPQQMFETYIKNAQSESIAAALGNIQSQKYNLDATSYRLQNENNRLLNKVDVNVPQNYVASNNLGISIQKNIAQMADTLSKLGGALLMNNYVSNDAVKTVQLA
jgi:hypothetical protein